MIALPHHSEAKKDFLCIPSSWCLKSFFCAFASVHPPIILLSSSYHPPIILLSIPYQSRIDPVLFPYCFRIVSVLIPYRNTGSIRDRYGNDTEMIEGTGEKQAITTSTRKMRSFRSHVKNCLIKIRIYQLIQFNWQVAISNDLVDIEEFERLTHQAKGLIKVKQHYI